MRGLISRSKYASLPNVVPGDDDRLVRQKRRLDRLARALGFIDGPEIAKILAFGMMWCQPLMKRESIVDHLSLSLEGCPLEMAREYGRHALQEPFPSCPKEGIIVLRW